jgi:hypothetical protein
MTILPIVPSSLAHYSAITARVNVWFHVFNVLAVASTHCTSCGLEAHLGPLCTVLVGVPAHANLEVATRSYMVHRKLK